MGERIPNWLLQRSHISPNKSALIFEDQVWTFREMQEIVQDLQEKLMTCLKKQDRRVAILMGSPCRDFNEKPSKNGVVDSCPSAAGN
ncbi:hypothetical protein ACA29_23630 [Lederbergia galactosidilytica]|uniref:Uncharacterized protein n=1 Tax=Lederbergia galactosidilytica TaxID=217031 RepID=A0A0Q9XVB3_9BACI|nr:hypothetical protein ACA29_23630 [Lederbergia galactosidilytica]